MTASPTPSPGYAVTAAAGEYDVFISYARKDNVPIGDAPAGWVSAVVRLIQEDQLRFGRPFRIFMDTSEITLRQDWEQRLRGALRTSKVLIVFVSPTTSLLGPVAGSGKSTCSAENGCSHFSGGTPMMTVPSRPSSWSRLPPAIMLRPRPGGLRSWRPTAWRSEIGRRRRV